MAVLVPALFSAGVAFSQTVNATLPETVTDTSGGVVPNAKAAITETNTGVSPYGYDAGTVGSGTGVNGAGGGRALQHGAKTQV